MDFKKLFGLGSSTPPPPPPPLRPPPPPVAKPAPKPAPVAPAAPVTPSIVGHWREPSGTDTTEFRANGTLVERPANGEMIDGRYSLDGSQLKVQLEGMPEELAFTIVLKGDSLEMTDADGNMTTYGRVQA